MSPQCPACESHVSRAFVRVFGVDGEITRCPACHPQDQRYAPGIHEGITTGAGGPR